MDLRIDPRQSVPIYAGALKRGDRVPSVRELAVAQRINRNTAAKAYGALEIEGILETRRGEGTFVAALPGPDDPAARARLVETFIARMLSEAAGLGLSATDLAEHITQARRASQRAGKPAKGGSS